MKTGYDSLYKKLEKTGYASDEKNSEMQDFHNKTIRGYFKEDVQWGEATEWGEGFGLFEDDVEECSNEKLESIKDLRAELIG